MIDLSGKVALVTGGGRGLGAATCLALAEAGAAVAPLARDSCEVTTVAEMIRGKGGQALGIAADVGDWDAVAAAIEDIRTQLGPVAIVVNNAAASTTGLVATSDPAEWAASITTNLVGPYYIARAALPDMIAANWGRVINVSSGSAVRAHAGGSAYGSSKAGLDHFTRFLAAELEGTGVVAVTIYPGVMDTRMQEQARSYPGPEGDLFRAFYQNGALRPPEESAALVRWLSGPDGERFRGQVVNVMLPEIRQAVGLPAL